MKKICLIVLFVLFFIQGIVGGLLFFWVNGFFAGKGREKDQTDLVELNRIQEEVRQNLTSLSELKELEFAYDFLVTDRRGSILLKYGKNPPESKEDCIRENNPCCPLEQENSIIGWVLVSTNQKERILAGRIGLARFVFSFSFVFLLLIFLFFWGIQRKILVPFEQMEKFAASVAAGNLDLPLSKGKKNYFGSFTESFDLMREELKLSREREYEANVSKKELVASLSHDIKTPVTSIKLMCEVLLVRLERQNGKEVEAGDGNLGHGNESEIQDKIHSIYKKAGQIDTLITDMFQSTLEELGELRVNISDFESRKLLEMIKSADYEGRIKQQEEAPDCLLSADTMRLSQVIGNVINNSYKYAQTPIEIFYEMEEDFLKLSIRDYGNGIDEEELPLVFQKFYRGKKVGETQKEGAGLGLFICKSLMEKMNGRITCRNSPDGFVVEVFIPLSSA